MPSENNLDTAANKNVSSHEEKQVSNTQDPSTTISDTKSKEEPADTSFEAPLVVDEKAKLNDVSKTESESTEDEEMDTQPLFEQSVLLEGKRSRKPTLRLELAESTPTKTELTIPKGRGKPLGEIEYINYRISHASADALTRMRFICFGRRGNTSNIRKHLRQFNGFAFEHGSDEYEKQLNNLAKLKKDQLRSISFILGLSATGRNTDHAERILKFLMEPTNEGKKIPKKKSVVRKKKSKVESEKHENNSNEHKIRRKKKTSTKSKDTNEETEEVNETNQTNTEQTDQNEVIKDEKIENDD